MFVRVLGLGFRVDSGFGFRVSGFDCFADRDSFGVGAWVVEGGRGGFKPLLW